MTKRKYVDVSVSWCNEECSPKAKVPLTIWEDIRRGRRFRMDTSYWYEGRKFPATFDFNGKDFGSLEVTGADGLFGFEGTVYEATITGGTFPEIEKFEVRDDGTIVVPGIEPPRTRSEFYDLSPDELKSPRDLLYAADQCDPLGWELNRVYDEQREELSEAAENNKRAAAQLEEMPDDPDRGRADWLARMRPGEFKELLKVVRCWLSEAPDWSAEEDFISIFADGQTMALQRFRGENPTVLATLGVQVIEGEHPGSSYFAAVLNRPVDEANRIARDVGIPVRFQNELPVNTPDAPTNDAGRQWTAAIPIPTNARTDSAPQARAPAGSLKVSIGAPHSLYISRNSAGQYRIEVGNSIGGSGIVPPFIALQEAVTKLRRFPVALATLESADQNEWGELARAVRADRDSIANAVDSE